MYSCISRLALFLCCLAFINGLSAQSPTITAPPLSKVVRVGDTLTASVAATGTSPLSYQWIHDGIAISGATTASLSIVNAATTDTGWYQVLVTNGQGGAHSTFSVDVALAGNALVAWGDNYFNESTIPPGLTNVAEVYASQLTFVLTMDGSVLTWPSFGGPPVTLASNAVAISARGSLLVVKSDGSVANPNDGFGSPLGPPVPLDDIVAVASGGEFAIVLHADGTLFGWGNNTAGVLDIPAAATNVVAIAAGSSHVAALRADGSVVAWGDDTLGQTDVPAGLTDVIAISAGANHTLALRRDGTVVAWGLNADGEATVPAGLSGVMRISANGTHSLALQNDGTLVTWGKLSNGPDSMPAWLAATPIRGIAAGNVHDVVLVAAVAPQILSQPDTQSVAPGTAMQLSVAASGTRPLVYVWKKNGVAMTDSSDGRIKGTNTPNLVLTQVDGTDAAAYTVDVRNAAGVVTSDAANLTVSAAPTFSVRPQSARVQIGGSTTFTVAASGSGTVTYQWRRNGQPIVGATGTALTLNSVTAASGGPYDVVATDAAGGTVTSVFYVYPTPLAAMRGRVVGWGNGNTSLITTPSVTNALAVSAGTSVAAVLSADGTVAEWGEQSWNATEVPSNLAGVVAISAGDAHILALKADGTVAAWGNSTSLQTSVPTGLGDVVAVAAGDSYSVALRANGTLVEWGSVYQNWPVDDASLGSIVAIAAGSGGILALKADGTVAALRNAYLNPPPADLAGVVGIAVGAQQYLALKADGTVVAWGSGPGVSVPAGLNNVVSIKAWGDESAALQADGTIVMWGSNNLGQTNVPSGTSPALAVSPGSNASFAIVSADGPTINVQPLNQTATTGTTVSFAVNATSAGQISYQWRKDGNALNDGSGVSGSSTSTLVISGATSAANGTYTVVLADATGSTESAGAVLAVFAPGSAPANDNFSSAQVITGTSGTVTGDTTTATYELGEPMHEAGRGTYASVWYTWTPTVPGVVTIDANGSAIPAAFAIYSGSAVNALSTLASSYHPFDSAQPKITANVQAGVTYDIAVASLTTARGAVALNWHFAAAPPNDNIANATRLNGDAGLVSGDDTAATGEAGEPPGGSTSSLWYLWTPSVTGRAVFSTSQMTFAELVAVYSTSPNSIVMAAKIGESTIWYPDGTATVTVSVTAGQNYYISIGSKFDNRGTFTLNWRLDASPAIVTPPAAQTAAVGGSAAFTIAATGGDLTYQWFHDGITLTGATNATLNLSNLTLADAGQYSVAVTNPLGSVAAAAVTLAGSNPAPVIVTQPTNLTAAIGQSAVFNVSATGTATLQYQWRHSGNPIAGATTETLTIPSVTPADEGNYDVAVYDGLSRTISAAVRLDVAPASYPGKQLFAAADLQPELATSSSISTVVAAPDGGFFIAGTFDSISGKPRSHLARFNADGSLDSRFLPPVLEPAVGRILPLSDGSVFVSGSFTNVAGEGRPSLAKLTATGHVDRSFGPLVVTGNVLAMAVDGSNRLLVGGDLAVNSFLADIYRLNPDGTQDTTFQGATNGSVRAIAIQPDGKILVAGNFNIVGLQSVAINRTGVARFNADGTPDPTFDISSWAPNATGNGLTVQSDGTILASGLFASGDRSTSYGVVEFDTNGALVRGFPVVNGLGAAYTASVQPSGKIVVTSSNFGYGNIIFRYNADGTVDLGFPFRSADPAGTYCLAVDTAGRIIVGTSRSTETADKTLERWDPDGAPDPAVSDVPRAAGTILELVPVAAGKTVMVGNFSYYGGMAAPMLVRANADGSPDASFHAPNLYYHYNGIFPMADGTMYVFGYDGPPRRLLADGSVDPSFTLPPNFTTIGVPVVGAELNADRLLVAASNSQAWGGQPVNGLVVIKPDGSRDLGFDAGTATLPLNILSVAVQSDQRVLVGGTFTSFNNVNVNRLVRLNADGSMDNSFSVGTGFDDAVDAISVQSDGRIVVAGRFSHFNGAAVKYAVRLNADGSIDSTFTADAPAAIGRILPQPDGKIIIAAKDVVADPSWYALRLNPDGTRDSSWLLRGQPTPLGAMQITDAGHLRAAVTPDPNTYGSTVPFGLAEYAPATDPTITLQPADAVVAPGDTATFSVTASGTEILRYQWSFNGAAIAGATNASLSLPNAGIQNAGSYAVTITNDYGSVTSSSAVLRGPDAAPVITNQPASVTTAAGPDVTLNITATSTGAIAYQWRRNGAFIPGATAASLDLGGATLLQNGQVFDVLVSDGLSVTPSSPVTVSVTPTHVPAVVSPDPTFTPTFDVANATIRAMRRLPNGQIYLAGTFSRFGTNREWNVARLDATGALDTSFHAAIADGPVQTLDVQSDGKVIIAGSFVRVDGQIRLGSARLNTDGSLDPTFLVGLDCRQAQVVRVDADDKVLVGSSTGLTRLDADGSFDDRFDVTTLNGGVYDIAVQSDGKLVVGGTFTGPGNRYSNLARLNADGSLDASFNPGAGPSLPVQVLRVLADGRILIGGHFRQYNGAPAGGIVRLTATGAIDSAWTGTGVTPFDTNSGVDAIDVQADGRILIQGSFYEYNGTGRLGIALLSPDGALDTSFNPIAISSGQIATHLSDGRILTGANSGPVQVVDLTGHKVDGAGPGAVYSSVPAVVVPAANGQLVAAGVFTFVNGVARPGIARLNADGSLDATFNAAGSGPDATVRSVVVQPDGRIVLAGDFESYNGTPQRYLVRVNLDGSLDTTFQPDTTGLNLKYYVQVYPLRAGRLLVYSLDFRYNTNFLRLDVDGRTEAAFTGPGGLGNGSVMAAAEADDGAMVVAGSFPGGVARYLADGAADSTFAASADSTVNSLVLLSDGKLLIGGSFLTVNGISAPRIARLNHEGSVDTTFTVGYGPNDDVTGITPQYDGDLLVRGWFTSWNGDSRSAFLVRLTDTGALDPTFGAIGLNGSAASLAIQDDGSLLLGGSLNPYHEYGVLRTESTSGPIFTLQPTSFAGPAGSSVQLTAEVVGGGTTTYQWWKDGVVVVGATQSTLLLPAAQADDSGSYTLKASAGGTTITSSAAAVAITASAPVVATANGPISGFGSAIALGSRWPLTAPTLAAGSSPITYQWLKDGNVVPGATNATLAPDWFPQNAGTYQVQISNANGTILSAPFAQQVTGARDWTWQYPSPQGNALYAAVYMNNRFVVGGVRGTVMSSPDGTAWSINRLGVSETVLGIAYGAGRYVALTSFGGVWSSPDAVQWTRREAGVTITGDQLIAITFDGAEFVAVGTHGTVVTSTDAVSWSRSSVNAPVTLISVAGGNGHVVALDQNGSVYRSADGLGWSQLTTFPRSVSALAYGAGRFVVVGAHASYVSTDGGAWSEVYFPLNATSIQFTTGQFVALQDAAFATSADGLTWTIKQPTGNISGATSLAYNGSRYVLTSSGPDALFTSTGATWDGPALGGAANVHFVGAAASGNTMMIVGSGQNYGMAWSSSDGAQWTVSDNSVPVALRAVAYGAGKFVSVGQFGKIRVKSDSASVWSDATNPITESLYAVAYLNGRFVAAGSNGTILTSTDGVTWTPQSSGTTQSLYGVGFGGGTYVAVGAAGTILSSADAVTWTTQSSGGISSNIDSVAYGAGVFVLVSEGGSIRSSTNGTTWSTQSNPLGYGFNSVIFAGGRFYAFILGNTLYASSADGVSWTAGQHGNANANIAPVVFGDHLYLVGDPATIVAKPLGITAPTIITQPESQLLVQSGAATLTVSANGSAPLQYQWFKDGLAIDGATTASLAIDNASVSDAGSYMVTVTNAVETVASTIVTVAVSTPSPGLVASIGSAEATSDGLHGAFTVEGSSPKHLLIRAVGPTLSTFSVANPLPDPAITVIDAQNGTSVAFNDDWSLASNASDIAAVTDQIGTYPLATGSKDAAVYGQFAPGSYRVDVGQNGGTGAAALEIYDTDLVPRLVYAATLGHVSTGKPVAEGIDVLPLSAGRTYLIRALGPSLGATIGLPRPQLKIFSGSTLLASATDGAGDAGLAAIAARVGAMPLDAANHDAVVNFTPPADGVYNVSVSSDDGTTGAVMLEVFEVDLSRSANVPLAIVVPPASAAVEAGNPASFGTVIVGRPAAAFQWLRGSTAIPGATNSTLTITPAELGDADTYTMQVSSNGTIRTASAILSVQPRDHGVQISDTSGYIAGAPTTISNRVYYANVPGAISWSVNIPAGWSFISDTASTASTRPAAGATGTLTWTWKTPPASPLLFAYTLSTPSGSTVTVDLPATVLLDTTSLPVVPSSLSLPVITPSHHSADTNGDGKISLLELTRVIELYNTRNGTTRTGCYSVQSGTEDGFAPDATRTSSATATLTTYHTADENHDGKISLLELTRVIELYNYRSGTTRTGQYHVQLGTEDGFAPGP